MERRVNDMIRANVEVRDEAIIVLLEQLDVNRLGFDELNELDRVLVHKRAEVRTLKSERKNLMQIEALETLNKYEKKSLTLQR